MSSIVISGRTACAQLLRLLADQIEAGDVLHPPSIMPAPHLGPYVVRVGGFDYDLAGGLPGIEDDPADDPAEGETAPGKGQR